jgi:hypothetical protein
MKPMVFRLRGDDNIKTVFGWEIEADSKIGFWFKVKAGSRFNPQAYMKYVEDLEGGTYAEIGPEDIFETAST